MKKIYISTLGILLFSSMCSYAQVPSSSQNHVVETVVKVAGKKNTVDLVGLPVSQANRTVSYLDGLGRPLQTVQWQGSPLQKDLVQVFTYDALGREVRKYLPYAEQSANDGSYKGNALGNQSSFYGQGTGWDANVPKTAYPFSQAVLEASPLNRVLEQGAPGAVWQPGTSRSATGGRTVVLGYGSNTAADAVKQWTVTTDGATSSGPYPANKLYKNVSRDENWTSGKGGTTEEFRDLEGRVVLKRVWKDEGTALDTYYVYDDPGNLRYVVPPAVTANSFARTADATFTNYIYGYVYDGRRRLVEKHVPGRGWAYMVYNRLDQLVLSQDARGRQLSEWQMTKYDVHGRVVITGIYEDNSSRENLQNSFNSCAVLWEGRSGAGDYTNTACPTSGVYKYLTVNYYDDYGFLSMGTTYPNTVTRSLRTRGLLTGTKVFRTDGSNPLWTLYYYDDEGRVVETVGGNHLGGTERVLNTYSFAGELKTSTRTHNRLGEANTVIANTYSYDHMGRKTGTTSAINGQQVTTLNRMEYNEVGQLKEKKLHSTDGTTFLQATKFAYNERGWLKGSTSPQFSMKLGYDTLSNPQYNGNIRTQQWGSGNSYPNQFNYAYDNLNRLTSAASTGITMNETIGYDVMGNITSMTRDNVTGTYSYTGNRLNGISGTLSTGSYGYDVNGNATTDGRTGVALAYNHLNLPVTATSSGLNLAYTYDANGQKLKKVNSTTATTTDYAGGIQYTNGAIEFIQTEEGRALNSSGSYSYQYNLEDHLGNVRYSFDIYGGAVRRLQEDNYYAFGLRRSAGTVVLDNRYLYNGKELQDELGQYDYGARFYDPVIGRWNVVDPRADSYHAYSPYNYALNDPIGKLDPNGLWVETARGYSTNDANEIASFLNQSESKEEDSPIKNGRNAINKPGTIIRKTQNGYSISQVPEGNGGSGLSDLMELGIGFTPFGIAIDIRNAFAGEDMSGTKLSWGWRLAGLIPLVSEFKNSNKVLKAATKTFGKEVAEVMPRIGRDGEAVEIIFKDGSKIDINVARVKEWVPNTHVKAPEGTLQKVKFENSLPGSKGYKREATQTEIKYLKNLLKK